MSDYKLTFKLKQHTPIIHFQHDQYGATLRASELKPKLDKFILKKLGGESDTSLTTDEAKHNKGFEIAKSKGWLIGRGEHPALDYKVRVNCLNVENNKISDRERTPNFFANMGKEFKDHPKSFSYSINDFEVILFVANDFKKHICDFFPEFIAKTNFGTRQNKGFGSFYFSKKSNCYKQIDETLKNYNYIEISSIDNTTIYAAIEYYYKRLKAGINFNFDSRCNREYHKSYLFQYFNKQTNKGWEKRFIKEEFFGLYKDNIEKYFVRALLGLPGNFTYKKTVEPCHKKSDIKISSSYEIIDDYEIEVYHPEIERYKSPLTFKPIKNGNNTRIFIIPEENFIQNGTSLNFTLYKKFIVKKLFFIRNNELKRKQQITPDIKGANQNDVDRLINDLETQEQKIDDFSNAIERINNQKTKRGFNKYLNNYIIGQKDRFKSFLDECSVNDGKYYPPSAEIGIPNEDFDLEKLLENYHINELHNSFTFKVERNDIHAKIKKL